ncbi:MAG: glycine cleavage system aminomethyltransferase GcvT, partial [Melioribacteraceae bacterium]|nr:glycine cleavage system aminomethyltransferase GcvT [Melioribacteraceae bacterium]
MKKTKLNRKHVSLGAKLVEFAGYEMPLQYSSIMGEHKAIRKSVGVFDVSHMGEVIVKGEKAFDFVQHITINDVSKLKIGRVQYTAMCYENGGIVDDLLVYNFDDRLLLVVNASNIEKDYEWISKNKWDDIEIENISDDTAQIALQGPHAQRTLEKLTDYNLEDIPFYYTVETNVCGVRVILSRTGYTGEDGF